jgi:hypothetical protein
MWIYLMKQLIIFRFFGSVSNMFYVLLIKKDESYFVDAYAGGIVKEQVKIRTLF